MGAFPSGSYLTISHAARDIDAEQMAEMVRRLNASSPQTITTLRDRAGVTRLFDGFDLVEPGVIRAAEWRPGSAAGAASPARPVGRRSPQSVMRHAVSLARNMLSA